MGSEVTDQLRCPICLEIPLKEIYQCVNGHTFCSNCEKGIKNFCPQCRTSLGAIKIRNRVLETLLDVMKFDCSFQIQGCTQKVSRNEIDSHKEGCKFGGDNVLLCQLMDYDCNYNTNSRRLEEAVGHLIDAHNCLYTCDENNQVVLNGISKLMNGQETSWEPLVFNFGGTKIILLTKSELNTIAFNCISLGDQKNKWKMQFEIAGKSTEDPTLEWSIAPIEYLKLKSLAGVLPYQIPARLLKNSYILKDNLIISICALKTNSRNSDSALELTGLRINIFPLKKNEDLKLPLLAKKPERLHQLPSTSLSLNQPVPKLVWVAAKNGEVPLHSFAMGSSESRCIVRAYHGSGCFPGNLKEGSKNAHITYGGNVIEKSSYEVLTAPSGMLKWLQNSNGALPNNAVKGGYDPNGDIYFIGQAITKKGFVCGKVHPRYKICYIASNGAEVGYRDYGILVKP